ncbi:hypothetical protein GCM10023200_27640 [Actinomycetospora chlora]|uniref:Glycoside hydrolase family 65 protein n=1 Tax=Actinomycetospora chlora TaxID=663608 RepID=A0ABP9B836_9PSEU
MDRAGPEPLGRTVEAVVVRWEHVQRGDGPAALRVRHRLAALSEHAVDLLVVTGRSARRVEATLAPALGPGTRWVWPTRSGRPFVSGPDGPEPLAGVAPGPPARAVGAFLDDLHGRGVGPGLVLLVPGRRDAELRAAGAAGRCATVPAAGPPEVLALLDEQLRRRAHRRVPTVDDDPAWTVTAPAGLARRAVDALFGLATGGVGTRGAAEEHPGAAPTVLAAGVYRGDGADQELRPLPVWTGLEVGGPAVAEEDRRLDLRTGVLLREERGAAVPLRTLRLAHAERPGVVALRAEAAHDRRHPGAAQRVPLGERATSSGHGRRRFARAGDDALDAAVVAAVQRRGRDGDVGTVERIARYATGRRPPPLAEVVADVDAAEHHGFDRLLRDQRAAWARRWEEIDVRIPDDPALQRALRFCLFHLWGLASGAHGGSGELAIGARGTSGRGYRGHVFWDADVFVVPALAAIDPDASRAAVRHRLARLPAARELARRRGHAGARFPWESGARGEDVTPATGLLGARPVVIRTGELEEHVTADVAWSAVHHAEWCREPQFLLGPARPLLVETARYWASRCRVDDEGRAHLDHVIGPDEYHEDVDDDAYTNILARWNLRAAADVADRAGVVHDEATRWRDLAGRLVDGLDPATGCHAQFRGYPARQTVALTGRLRPPVAADVVLGHAGVERTQVIKQPDVLMAHHLVPAEAGPSSLLPDLDLYGPRTAHGSSLSPGIAAAVAARAGRTDEALELLRTCVALDLEDLTGTVVSGLHVAAMGAAWQAVLTGFAGVRVEHGALHLAPRLPAAWSTVEVRFRALGRRLRVQVDADTTTVTTDLPVTVRYDGGPPARVTASATFPRTPDACGRPA